jgi:DNA invertase Pin-like site-specific DNA recombinase
MFFNILATFAEFEVDLLRLRTREGMAIARAKGKLKGRAPKLSPPRQAHLVKLHAAGALEDLQAAIRRELGVDRIALDASIAEPEQPRPGPLTGRG